MYLSDRHLKEILPELRIDVEPGSEPFSAEEQVQPASIDFRLSSIFWVPRKRFTVDLRRARLLEIQPRRYYKKLLLSAGETVVLKPRQLLLARTLEKFLIPDGYVGELVGRSSFARLGLIVSATGGHINPGWHGHMPMQLFNLGPNPIRLVAGLPICQVKLAKLTSLVDRSYGDPSLDSKYMDDDGGPSYWWRDKRIKKLHFILAEKLVEEKIQNAIYEIVGFQEPEVIERLEKRVAKMRVGELQNADTVLDTFAQSEDRRRRRRQWTINLSRASFTVGISSSLWAANKIPIQWWHYLVWLFALCLVGVSVYAFRTEVGDHLGNAELRSKRRPV